MIGNVEIEGLSDRAKARGVIVFTQRFVPDVRTHLRLLSTPSVSVPLAVGRLVEVGDCQRIWLTALIHGL